MSDISHSDELVTKQELASFYQGILPYLGGMPTAIADKFDRSDIYSTDEKIIGCWTDGRPLYQKVITGTTSSGAGGTEATATNDYFSIGSTVNFGIVKGFYLMSTSGACIQLNQCSDYDTNIRCNVISNSASSNKNTFHITNIVQAWSSRPFYAIVNYTKTTDAANSFNCSSESDYSTSEKVVGTWVDGKPLYQKTLTGTTPNCTTTGTNVKKYIAVGASVKEFISIQAVFQNGRGGYIPLEIATGIVNDGLTRMLIFCGNNASTTSAEKNQIVLQNNNVDWSNKTIYVTVQYTKTTD